ncbi:hypothetical protein Q7P37_009943 [Cladosporium fusiforme]
MPPKVDRDDLQSIFHHVFLPSMLPQHADDASDPPLLRAVLTAMDAFCDILPDCLAVKHALIAIENLQAVNSLEGCATSESILSHRLMELEDGHTIPIHCRSQNAAIIITRQKGNLIFEEFELSPRNEAAIGTKGRLIRIFPGLAVEINLDSAEKGDFVPAVANMLATMCQQPVTGMQPQSKKARGNHSEIRDTTHPATISELFFGFLRGFGSPVSVSAVSKNTREEVLWKNAEAPWRRSPLWLLIRVVLQLTLERSTDGSRLLYKETMVFIMSQHLQSSLEQDVSAEDIYSMSAKIARRLCKIHKMTPDSDENARSPVIMHIEGVLRSASESISDDWDKIQRRHSRELDFDGLADLKFEPDTYLDLPSLDKHIEDIHSRRHGPRLSSFSPISNLIKHTSDVLPQLPGTNGTTSGERCYTTANLQQFEQWIGNHLQSWIKLNVEEGSCEKLYNLMVNYHELAGHHYSENPEATSVMLLTILEIWDACDEIATKVEPRLEEYNPEIPYDALESCLLPFYSHMERLALVESHLQQREKQSRFKHANMLFDMSSPEGFASRYFGRSPAHQNLLSHITQQAEVARLAKQTELERTRDEYRRLNTLHNSTSCSFTTVVIDDWVDPPETTQKHRHDCAKCWYRMQRDALKISVHEWPLPQDPFEAQAVVFELDVPSWFAFWRDARLYLLQNVLRGERHEVDSPSCYRLSITDPHLSSSHFRGSRGHRVDLLSECKPFTVSHYRSKKVDTALRVSDVCVASGLRYQYYDAKSHRYIGTLNFPSTVAKSCMYKLSNQQLQQYIFRPFSAPDGPSPNCVIASQDSCPDGMSLEEYKELASVPLGHHIQWANMILQLAMPSVDFKKEDTTLVFLQCIYQLGPPNGNVLRESHRIFSDDAKVASLIDHTKLAIDRVKQNWESAQALRLFVAILTRTLSLSTAAANSCLELLAQIRVITLDWMDHLRDRAYAAVDHRDRTAFVSQSVEVAMICTSTFDVDEPHMSTMMNSADAVSALVQCAIIVQQGKHVGTHGSKNGSLLFLRHHRMLHRSYMMLARCQSGLDDAAGKSWSAYIPGCDGWKAVSDVADNWLTTKTSTGLEVHYNSLDGEFLVNGLPMDQPPSHYREQELYSTLFGRAIVEVMPPSSPGFQFSTKRRFQGCEVQLGMRESSSHTADLLFVRTFDGNNSTDGHGTFETIPHQLLVDIFPESFVKDHVHWYNHGSGNIEFRPRDSPWISDRVKNWTMVRGEQSQAWRLSRGCDAIIGSRKPTSIAISGVLEPLMTQTRVHCILRSSTKQLRIDIPALRLWFHLGEGTSEFRSREYRNMAVDRMQSIGTLVGFDNKLLLRSETGKRLLLIKEATLSYAKKCSHMAVSVDEGSAATVHALHIDTQLRRLVDNGDLQCKLYLAYLHALTSSCLPDPSLGVTGTERALSILRSAAVRSFHQLSQSNLDTLEKIARLSPCRQHYPAHLRVMQTVSWDPQLHFLAQHAELRIQVDEIFQQAQKIAFLHPDSVLRFPCLPHLDEHLRNRDMIRDSSFRVPGFGAENHSVKYDQGYKPRDRNIHSENAVRTASISQLLYRTGHDKHWETTTTEQLWERMSILPQIEGSESRAYGDELRYDAAYLNDGVDSILARLPSIRNSLAASQQLGQRRFAIMGWFASLGFPLSDVECRILQIFAMFFKSENLAHIQLPLATKFRVQEGRQCSTTKMRRIVQENIRGMKDCPEYSLPRGKNEGHNKYHNRRAQAWQRSSNSAVNSFIQMLETQWPREMPVLHLTPNASIYINIESVMHAARAQFKTWYDNRLLYEYLENVVHDVTSLKTCRINIGSPVMLSAQRLPSMCGYIATRQLFFTKAPRLPTYEEGEIISLKKEVKSSELQVSRLPSLVQTLCESDNTSEYQRRYVADLQSSLEALILHSRGLPVDQCVTHEEISQYKKYCETHVAQVYSLLIASLCRSHSTSSTCGINHWPRLSPTLLLQQLSHSCWVELSDSWKTAIVEYGIALTTLQRAERLAELVRESNRDGLMEELQNIGHTNWSPYKQPEWLLMEVESGIMIRHIQTEIAKQMQQPDCCHNAVMQLNMGEGKSSVIAPLVAAALADGSRLVRVVVAKPQSKQMAQMLISKLGGLVNRRIYYLPFSRDLSLDEVAVKILDGMLRECMANRGILLVQPEHILSFKLMGPECYISGNEEIGRQLVETQDFLDEHSRDIVDESDENFSVRFELIYTMGMQNPIEMSPDRWYFAQQVSDILKRIAPTIAEQSPGSLEIHPAHAGGFSRIRVLRTDVGVTLVNRIAKEICEGGLDKLQIARQPAKIRNAVYIYITKLELDGEETDAVEGGDFWTNTTKAPLLLLRGILAGGVLIFALSQKRWRVNYGLASRTPTTRLAVPYRAKDSPSLRSEFSHPDVVILLTSLCYYYQGLDDEDLFTAFAHLVDSDQADIEYQSWVNDALKLPSAFRQLQGVNLKDRSQCVADIFPALRHGKSTVDYFLSHIVFPKEMRDFTHKLSASGWDIGKQKTQLVTGFSGTNDSKYLLPLDVEQLDLRGQKHTNAMVLEHLLQDGNSVKLLTTVAKESTEATTLLTSITQLKPEVQVILDVGAQILELSNIEVAASWLELSASSKEAVVFVNDKDEICVTDREGRIDLLHTSSYASRLDSCLVFLDESHTRGIDLKLPVHYRAAVTLGANITKDRLVQAFSDVLLWSIGETHREMQRSMPLWAVQGQRFIHQQSLWQQVMNDGKTTLNRSHAERFLELESQTLEQRYRPEASRSEPSPLLKIEVESASSQVILDRCHEFGHLQFSSSVLHEEQERELSPEIEQERQVQKPPPAIPAIHHLHPDVKRFALAQSIDRLSEAYTTAFQSLSHLSIANTVDLSKMAAEERLMVSADFATTVRQDGIPSVYDAFQRHISWILTRCTLDGREIDSVMVISPFEANLLYPCMEGSPNTLHVYKPRSNLGYAALDDLLLHTVSASKLSPVVPRALLAQLSLFSGQLYISSYADYLEICLFLGVSARKLTEEMEHEGWQLDADGFILRDGKGQPGGRPGMRSSPVSFFKAFLSKIRRNGDGIHKTHMGGLLEGKLFSSAEWQAWDD